MKAIVIGFLAATALTGCAIQPAPHADLPASVGQLAPAAWLVDAPRDPLAMDAWWDQFSDPVMHRLVASVLDGNLDLQAALERVKQADAVTAGQRSRLAPQLDANANAVDARQNTPPPLGYVRQAGFGVAASWAPDVFGGERLSVLAAAAQASGRREALDQLRLALAASTASAYIDLRWAQAEFDILQRNALIRERALRLTQQRRQYGLSTSLDVARAQNQLSELQARMPRVQSTIQHQLSLLAIYAGRTPEDARQLVTASQGIPMPARAVPDVLPSATLLQRPDVRNAYATVQQRAAEVGMAQAERYPQFSLRLTDGLLASSYLGLPTLTDNLFSAALGVTSPIFNAGRINADIAANQSRMREAELNLRQTMLLALKDVEDSRTDLLNSATQADRLGGALSASDHALQLSSELYKGGAASFLDVLAAQDSYLNDADALNQARRENALAAVALYRSLGGGWQQPATELSSAATPTPIVLSP